MSSIEYIRMETGVDGPEVLHRQPWFGTDEEFYDLSREILNKSLERINSGHQGRVAEAVRLVDRGNEKCRFDLCNLWRERALKKVA